MTVFEFAQADLPFVQFDAYIQLPAQPALVELSADLLSSGTINASGTSFRELTSRTGDQLRVNVLRGGLRLTARVQIADASAAASLFGKLLSSRSFEAGEVRDHSARLPFKFRTPMQEAMSPFRYDLRSFGKEPEVKLNEFWNKRKVAVGIRGPLIPGELRRQILETPSKVSPGAYTPAPFEVPLEGRQSTVGSLSWFSRPTPKEVENLAELSLAAFVLGVGKESLLFSELRTRRALTYRQEAMVLVGPKGLQLLAITMRDGKLQELEDAVQTPLQARIENLRSGDIDRAKVGLLRALEGTFPVNPLSAAGLAEGDDKAFQAAFSFLEFGDALAIAKLGELIPEVQLRSVQRILSDLFKESPNRIPGR